MFASRVVPKYCTMTYRTHLLTFIFMIFRSPRLFTSYFYGSEIFIAKYLKILNKWCVLFNLLFTMKGILWCGLPPES